MPKGRQVDEKMKFMGFILMTALFLPYNSYLLIIGMLIIMSGLPLKASMSLLQMKVV